jgi:hypothetical protein
VAALKVLNVICHCVIVILLRLTYFCKPRGAVFGSVGKMLYLCISKSGEICYDYLAENLRISNRKVTAIPNDGAAGAASPKQTAAETLNQIINKHTHYGKDFLSVEKEPERWFKDLRKVVRPRQEYRNYEHPQVG